MNSIDENREYSLDENHNPRKAFEDSVDYAIGIANGYLEMLAAKKISPVDLNYLEIGPGADFAPQLVLASHGARVTLADPYLADWDPNYHPMFYDAFLSKWTGRKDAIVSAVRQNGYQGLLTLAKEPAERMKSVPSATFDLVQSNAALEHVLDLRRTARELARVTRVGGINAHQVDFRDHRNFERPLDYLLYPPAEYRKLRKAENGIHGTTERMPELIDAFSKYFLVWEIEINLRASTEYAESIRNRLPSGSRYRSWPTQLLRDVSGRAWFVRKETLGWRWRNLLAGGS